jgi:tRNA (adenine57-N1/adenine58-N1)-methyltransferase catalytic subunit
LPATFQPGERALLIDSRGRRYLVSLNTGGAFHFHRGIVSHDDVIGEQDGAVVKTTGGERVVAVRPTLADYVLKMRRGAQVVYPKDLAMIVLVGDVFPGATVIEAGAGSGALTIALARAVGEKGRVITYELREDFLSDARRNVTDFLGEAPSVEIKQGSIYEPIQETDADRFILDLPEPWRAIPTAAATLRSGGILVSYLPSTTQVSQLTESLTEDGRWLAVTTIESLVRSWHVEGPSVRPDHRMVAHTGFITYARFIPNL